jgi:hypothetical protein
MAFHNIHKEIANAWTGSAAMGNSMAETWIDVDPAAPHCDILLHHRDRHSPSEYPDRRVSEDRIRKLEREVEELKELSRYKPLLAELKMLHDEYEQNKKYVLTIKKELGNKVRRRKRRGPKPRTNPFKNYRFADELIDELA